MCQILPSLVYRVSVRIRVLVAGVQGEFMGEFTNTCSKNARRILHHSCSLTRAVLLNTQRLTRLTIYTGHSL